MTKKNLLDVKKLWELNEVWDVLSDYEKEYLDANSHVLSFKKNEVIQREGEEPENLMMLVSGKLRVYKEGVSNRSQIIRMLKPCDFFGYRAMIADEYYNTSVGAIEPCVVYLIKKEAFIKVLQQNNRLCYLFMVLMAKDLGESDTRSVNLTQKHIRGRLAEALISLKEKYGYDEDEATISMYMSREDLANLSNMTTSNAIRTLSNFADEGVISLDGRKIKILDEPMLVRISRLG